MPSFRAPLLIVAPRRCHTALVYVHHPERFGYTSGVRVDAHQELSVGQLSQLGQQQLRGRRQQVSQDSDSSIDACWHW